MPQVMLLYRWQYTKTNSKLGLTQFFFPNVLAIKMIKSLRISIINVLQSEIIKGHLLFMLFQGLNTKTFLYSCPFIYFNFKSFFFKWCQLPK